MDKGSPHHKQMGLDLTPVGKQGSFNPSDTSKKGNPSKNMGNMPGKMAPDSLDPNRAKSGSGAKVNTGFMDKGAQQFPLDKSYAK